MGPDADSEELRSEQACSWCGSALAPRERERPGRVCDRCVRLLREAGVPEEEIFGGDAGER